MALNAEILGQPNPDVPGLDITVGNDPTKPDGGVSQGTNLAALFNIAGTSRPRDDRDRACGLTDRRG